MSFHLQRGGRAAALDELRGLAILLMVAHHAAWDLDQLFGIAIPLLRHPLVLALQALFAGLFIFISGMVCNVSRSNLRRGFLTLLCALAVTAVTALAMPGQTVWFGVLHLLAVCMLLYAWGEKLWRRISPPAGVVVCLLLFAATWALPAGWLRLAVWNVGLPQGAYDLPLGFVLGLPSASFVSADYFPLMPWAFLFFAGSFAGRPVFTGRSPAWLFRPHAAFLSWVGRRTLWIYLLHQPLLLGLMWLLLGR